MNLRTFAILAALTASAAVPFAAIGAPTLKKIVAVSRFDNKTAYSQAAIGTGMADQLTAALMKSGQFIVVERQNISDVIKEENFANSGRVMKAKSAETGKLVAAQILIQGDITEYDCKTSGSSSGIGFGGFHIGDSHQAAHVGLILRLIDTTTGEVIAAQRVEGTAKSGGMSFGVSAGAAQFGTSGFKSTPMGKAVQMAIDNAVEKIAAKLKNVPFQAHVILAAGDKKFYVSGGQSVGMSVGETFSLYSVGQSLVDPATGEQLGSVLTKMGTVKIASLQPKYAIATSDTPITGIKPGDIIKDE